jgi:outer membrane protein OmpA-like peptidoglycan-associated protein/flagellar hook assembly protein FlgD
MKKVFMLLLIVFSISAVFAVQDGSQWIYTGFSPSTGAMGYTGVAWEQFSGDIMNNPANPGFVRRIRLFGEYGIASPNSLLNLGVSLPTPVGVLTAAVNSVYFNHSDSVNSVMGFKIGFAKKIEDDFSFGFDIYGVNQAIATVGNSFGIGLDLGIIARLKNKQGTEDKKLAFKNKRIGIALLGLGKPAEVVSGNPLPGIGIRLGFATDFLDLGKALKMGFETDVNFDVYPLNIFANLGLKITIADHLNLMGGLIAGNNDIGSFTNNGIAFYTLGVSFDYQFGETPVEIFYTYSPYSFNNSPAAVHFIGTEIAFGLLDKKAPETKIEIKQNNDDIATQDEDMIYLSPNYDGSQDDVEIKLAINDGSLIKNWKLEVVNEDGNTVKTFYGKEERDVRLTAKRFFKKLFAKKEAVKVPNSVTWNGTADDGNMLPNGKYRMILTSKDELNNTGASSTNAVTLDNIAPTADIGLDYQLFSPNGDGNKDEITITQNLSDGNYWKTEIRDMDGKLISDWEWKTNAPKELKWDGKDNKGDTVPDGSYDYLIFGRDKAGNRTIMSIKGIKISTKPHSMFLALDRPGFSPNNDGVNDVVVVTPTLSDPSGLKNWRLEIKDKDDKIVRTFDGTTEAPKLLEWKGTNDEKTIALDGEYKFQFNAIYDNGDKPSSSEHKLILDTTPPDVSYDFQPKLFSPDDDGENDLLSINLAIGDINGIESWKMDIFDPDNHLFKTFSGKGTPAEEFTWNGLSDKGELVESAQDYKVKVTTTDIYGNKIVKDLTPIPIDILVEKIDRGLKIRISSIEFDTGKAKLSKKSRVILTRVAHILKKYDQYKIEVQGHTDNVGSTNVNLRLSKKRAEAVKWWVARKGVRKNRMTTVGHAFLYPVADNETPEGKRKNRRVELILIKQ